MRSMPGLVCALLAGRLASQARTETRNVATVFISLLPYCTPRFRSSPHRMTALPQQLQGGHLELGAVTAHLIARSCLRLPTLRPEHIANCATNGSQSCNTRNKLAGSTFI